jgi:hypothetical protein
MIPRAQRTERIGDLLPMSNSSLPVRDGELQNRKKRSCRVASKQATWLTSQTVLEALEMRRQHQSYIFFSWKELLQKAKKTSNDRPLDFPGWRPVLSAAPQRLEVHTVNGPHNEGIQPEWIVGLSDPQTQRSKFSRSSDSTILGRSSFGQGETRHTEDRRNRSCSTPDVAPASRQVSQDSRCQSTTHLNRAFSAPRICTVDAGYFARFVRLPACEISLAPTISPIRAARFGATSFILDTRYACSSLRYSTSSITRWAKFSMLIRSMGEISWPAGRTASSQRVVLVSRLAFCLPD